MALNGYLQSTQRLLFDAEQRIYNIGDLKAYVNEGRQQLAGESSAIKRLGTFTTTINSMGPYPFSAITLSNNTGIAGILNVRQLLYTIGTGQLWMRPRSFPWFTLYHLNDAAPDATRGVPEVWSQYGEGTFGTLYVAPQSDFTYTVNADCICYPVDLTDDTTAETLPLLWTQAIPYYAAYRALLSSPPDAQAAGERMKQAEQYWQLYERFVTRARAFATPDIVPQVYPQQPDMVREGRLGMTGGGKAAPQ